MMWWWSVGIPAVVGARYLWSVRTENGRRLQLWMDALSQRGVTEAESSGPWVWRAQLTARSGPLEVRLTHPKGKGDRVAVVIEGPEAFSLLKLRRQILKLWTHEIEIGDEAFDDAFLIEGPVRSVCALLDAPMRRQLTQANAACKSLEISDGKLQAEISEKALSKVLPLLLDIGRQLAKPLDMERRIARNARRDPKAGVRLLNLQLLIREHPGDPVTMKALRHACSDPSPKVRVRAAIELGEEGRPVLLGLTERSGDDASCAQAVSHLGGELPFERAKRILARSRHKGFSQTARACLEVLGRRRAAAVGTLVGVLTEEKGELATAAALALGTTGEEAAVPPLLQALQSEDSELRDAAATALGHVGSIAAVQPLQEVAERFWLDRGFRRATHQAIAEIQSRVQGASPGQLSLSIAGPEAGQLSLASGEAGQLSFAPEEAGRLSLPPKGPEKV